jgi:hypothetical protein
MDDSDGRQIGTLSGARADGAGRIDVATKNRGRSGRAGAIHDSEGAEEGSIVGRTISP